MMSSSRRFGMRATAAAVFVLVAAMLAGAASTASGATKVTLKLLTWYEEPTWKTGYGPNIDAYLKRNPGLEIKLERVQYAQYQQKLGTYQASGRGPDIVFIDGPGMANQFRSILQDVSKVVPQSTLAQTNGLIGGCPDFDCKRNGLRALPMALQGHPWYYNRAILRRAGVASPPKTFRQLATACGRVKALGLECIASGQDLGGLITVATFFQAGVTPTQARGLLHTGRTRGNESGFVLAYALWEWLNKQGFFQKDVRSAGLGEAVAVFTTGKAAFYTGLLSDGLNWQTIAKAMPASDLGAILPPQIERNFPIPGYAPGAWSASLDVGTGPSLGVPKWSNKQVAAGKLLAYLASPGPQLVRARGHGAWPANKRVNPKAIKNPAFAELVTLANASKGAVWPYLDSSTFGTMIADSQLLLSGGVTPDKAAANLADAVAKARTK